MSDSVLVHSGFSLRFYNTFGVDVSARLFASVQNVEELRQVLANYPSEPIWYLGGGSNLLLTKDLDALVIHLNLLGREKVYEDERVVRIRVGAGERWHDLVSFCVEQDLGGIENLALIPGNVGSAPVQNIGAYGRELKDAFWECEVLDRTTGEVRIFTQDDCDFGYRSSVFKKSPRGQLAIVSVTLQLTKQPHVLSLEYGALRSELENQGVTHPMIQDVFAAVVAIRSSKLPDPAVLGNSGSFFKNPVLQKEAFLAFSEQHPEAPFFAQEDGSYKVPAGWLIDQAGLRGARMGNVGTYEKQALVIVNYGGASGSQIWEFAQFIQQTVFEKFGIQLEPEVLVL